MEHFTTEQAFREAASQKGRLEKNVFVDLSWNRDGSASWVDEKVRLRTAELSERTSKLETFCNSIAHDMRQHIRGVCLNAQLIKLSAEVDRESADALERLLAASKQMDHLVTGLLAYARSDGVDFTRECVDLSLVADEVARDLAQAHPGLCTCIEPGIRAHADPTSIRLVLQNLFENAGKYARADGPAFVEFGSRRPGEFFVRDNGIGFDMLYHDRIFQAFERLHSNDNIPGNGIGLATSKRIIERHGGSMWARSEPGTGSTFFFTLP